MVGRSRRDKNWANVCPKSSLAAFELLCFLRWFFSLRRTCRSYQRQRYKCGYFFFLFWKSSKTWFLKLVGRTDVKSRSVPQRIALGGGVPSRWYPFGDLFLPKVPQSVPGSPKWRQQIRKMPTTNPFKKEYERQVSHDAPQKMPKRDVGIITSYF